LGVYLQPTELKDALQALQGLPLTILAGGTDVYPARVERAVADDVLDISRMQSLKRIEEHEDHWRIGAGVTWTQLIRAPLPGCFDGLKAAAREVGGVQIQNVATLAGNICNASPAADGVPNLMALDTLVELQSGRGARTLPVSGFITGNRRTRRAPDEMVTALLVPRPRRGARSTFLKLGARKYLVISIVMVAGVIEAADDGTVAAGRIAVGACSAVAQRLATLEAALAGLPLASGLADAVRPEHLDALAPIDDVRAPAAYRRDAALTLVRRALHELAAA
jgi:CO/xanthine dehydrogenase FAD-binding subunit